MSGPETLPRSGTWTSRLRLQDWAKVDASGHYVVSVKHDLVLSGTLEDVFGPAAVTVPIDVSIAVDVR